MVRATPHLRFPGLRTLLFLCGGLVFGGYLSAQSRDGDPSLNERRAAYVFNICRFASWPERSWADGEAPLVVAVVSPDGVADPAVCRVLEGKVLDGGRRLTVRTFDTFAAAVEAGQVVLLSPGIMVSAVELRQATVGHAVLIVGESPGLASAGATANLVVSGGQAVRLEINRTAAERAGVVLSSRLGAVATLVRETSLVQ